MSAPAFVNLTEVAQSNCFVSQPVFIYLLLDWVCGIGNTGYCPGFRVKKSFCKQMEIITTGLLSDASDPLVISLICTSLYIFDLGNQLLLHFLVHAD